MEDRRATQLDDEGNQPKLLKGKSIVDEVNRINKLGLGSRRPVIEKGLTRYEWQDTSLLPLLAKGLEPVYIRRTFRENEEAEKLAISIANELVAIANRGYGHKEVEEALGSCSSGLSGYAARRLADVGVEIVESAKARKGLLIYGEGVL